MSRNEPVAPWSVPVRLSEVGRVGPMALAADEPARVEIARVLDIVALKAFTAEVRLTPWHDGVELRGSWKADVVYRCGITIEPFEQALQGDFIVRAVPAGSKLAQPESEELELDPDSDDPPDVLEDDRIDVGAYLIEHLALELDPFPRRPGAVFEPPAASEPESPFAVLLKLRPDEPKG